MQHEKGALQIVRKLYQVYCVWLIKWVVKREIILLAQLSLSVSDPNQNYQTKTHQTKPTKPNLTKQAYWTKHTKPYQPNQTKTTGYSSQHLGP